VLTYWKQQRGYGKAEAMLERKWPEKYNLAGHARWSGRVYTNGLTYMGWRARRIYHGLWGTAPFQSLYEPAPSGFESLPMMPEWYLIIIALAVLSVLGSVWRHPCWVCVLAFPSPKRCDVPLGLVSLPSRGESPSNGNDAF
jgi:fatty acid desaturase